MSDSSKLFEEFVMRRCEEHLNDNEEYKDLRNKSVEMYNTLNTELDTRGKDILEEYEVTVNHINDLIFSTLCKLIRDKNSCV